MKIAGYVRVSTTSQAETGESLRTQIGEIKDFAKMKKWELSKIYEDRGLSGGKAESRPGFMSMIADAENKNFQGICFSRLSRFARNAGDFLFYSNRLKEYGVTLFSLKEGIDPSTNTGKLMMGLMALIAEWEKESIREQMATNKMARWSENRTFIGKPPFGYIWDKEKKKLEINPKEAKTYAKMISMYVDQGLSFKSIALALKEEGIRCKQKFFSSVTVSYIFKNPAYYGNYLVNKFKYIQNSNGKFNRSNILKPASQHITFSIPALISKIKWDALQEKIASKQIKSKRSSEVTLPYWLRDVLICGECGGKIKPHHGSKRKDGTFARYYSCYWADASPQTLKLSNKKEKCRLPLIKADELEKLIWRGLMRPFAAGLNADSLKPLFDPIHYEEKIKDIKGQITRHKAELKKKERAKGRLWNFLDKDDGLFDKNDLSEQLTLNKDQCLEIEARIEELQNRKKEIVQIKENDLQARAFISDNKESLRKAYADIMQLDPADKKMLFEGSLTGKIEIALAPGESSEGEPKWEVKKNDSNLNFAVLQALESKGKISNIFNKNSSNHTPAPYI